MRPRGASPGPAWIGLQLESSSRRPVRGQRRPLWQWFWNLDCVPTLAATELSRLSRICLFGLCPWEIMFHN